MGEIFDANMAYICNDCGLHPFPGTDQARDASSNSDWSLPEGLTFKFYLYDFYKNKRISANKELLKQWLQLHGVVVEFVDSETGGSSYRRKSQRGVECGVIAAKVLTMLIQNRDLLKQPTIVRDGALSKQHHSEGIEHAPREQRQFEGFLHELAGHLFLVREPGEIARIYAHGSGANAR